MFTKHFYHLHIANFRNHAFSLVWTTISSSFVRAQCPYNCTKVLVMEKHTGCIGNHFVLTNHLFGFLTFLKQIIAPLTMADYHQGDWRSIHKYTFIFSFCKLLEFILNKEMNDLGKESRPEKFCMFSSSICLILKLS